MEAPRLEPVPAAGERRGVLIRVIVGLGVLTLALLGILVVLDVVPRDAFADLASRVGAVAAIVLLTALILSFLLRRPPR
jgi:hypothetical protein